MSLSSELARLGAATVYEASGRRAEAGQLGGHAHSSSTTCGTTRMNDSP